MIRPELHRPLPLEQIGPGGRTVEIEANPAECAALAHRLGIPAVLALSCRFRLGAPRQGQVPAEGELRARLRRVCVVTLDEFDTEVSERFHVRFVPAGKESEAADDPEADDEIPYENASLDLGEAAVEQLALGLDAYPRKPGAVLPEEAEDLPESPFAALGRLRPPRA